MAVTEIPTFTDTGNYEYTIDLDGTVFVFGFIYNARDLHWYLDISDEEGTRIRSGIKLTTGNFVLFEWRVRGRPVGELIMVDPSGAGREAAFDDIGSVVSLNYLDESSILELAG